MSSFEKQSQNKSLAVPDLDDSLAAAILDSKRTQLQQKGEHLLVASSLQHGLSPSVRGSLSDVIASLPEDKELREQGLALQSSSSTDLVEDRSFPESLHDHDVSSFVCLLCEEKAVASVGELSHTSLLPCQQSQPKQLSSKEQPTASQASQIFPA